VSVITFSEVLHLSLHVYILLVLIVLLYDMFHFVPFSLTEVGDNTVTGLGLAMWEKLTSLFSMVIMAGSSAWSVRAGGVTAEHDFTFCLTTEPVRKTDSVDGLSCSQDAVVGIAAGLPHTTIRGLFKKYRTFGRQKYNYLFGCLKP